MLKLNSGICIHEAHKGIITKIKEFKGIHGIMAGCAHKYDRGIEREEKRIINSENILRAPLSPKSFIEWQKNSNLEKIF